MNKPTLQEIEEAIRTLASAGMLLNAEQTIAVNRVRQEMEQQAEEEARRRIEEEVLRKAEIQRLEEEARRIEAERMRSRIRALTEYENSLVDGLWQIFKQPWLHKTFKDRLCELGMRESVCSSRISHLKYKIVQIDGDKTSRKLVENCSTIAEMRKLIDSFLATWGYEERFAWRKEFFHDYLSFLTFVIFRPDTKKKDYVEPAPKPQPLNEPTPNPQPQMVVKEPQQVQPTLFPNEEPQKRRRQVQLIDANWRKLTLDPFDALKAVVLRVGCEKVAKMGIQVGRTKLLRLTQPIGTKNYIQLNRYYWLQNRGTDYEIFVNILKIIEADNHVHFKEAKLISPNNALF